MELKRMWVHPDWRGAGLGSRMLRHLESLADEVLSDSTIAAPAEAEQSIAEADLVVGRAVIRALPNERMGFAQEEP